MLKELNAKQEALDSSFKQIKGLEADVSHSKLFIERELPALIHLQLSEGLNIVAGDYMTELKSWEKTKLTQLQSYIRDALGKDANTHQFRDRIIFFIDKLVKNNKGAVPFIFDGDKGDYYPYYENITRFGKDKDNYSRNRGAVVSEKKRLDAKALTEKV